MTRRAGQTASLSGAALAGRAGPARLGRLQIHYSVSQQTLAVRGRCDKVSSRDTLWVNRDKCRAFR